MFSSSLGLPGLWNPFLTHPIFAQSFDWIRAHAGEAAPGKYELGQEGWFVSVDAYETRPAADCQWENHTKTIDLQYLMEGVEGLRVLPAPMLGDPVLYKEASDTQKFASTEAEANLVVLRPGDFVIFMPGEAHCPKIAIGGPAALRKLVVKIPAELVKRDS